MVLLNFRVANYGAFREPQELSLYRARGLRSDSAVKTWQPKVSPIAVIYGPNASGKSTLYRAMEFVRKAVRNSYQRWPVDGGIPGSKPFLLDSISATKPSEFEVEFIATDSVRYQYGFQVSAERVQSEWLYAYRTANRSIIYERGGSDSELYFGNSFRGNRTAISEAIHQRPNALLLSVAAQLGNELTSSAHRWLTNHFRTYDARQYESEHRHLIKLLQNDDDIQRQLSEVLSQADLGITNVAVTKSEVDPAMLERTYEAVRILSDDEAPALDDEQLAKLVDSAATDIQFLHRTAGDDVPFPLAWESDGTQALLSFASVAMKTLRTGSTMIVDEIDSSLHPIIVAELVRVFRNGTTNPLQAQLIVTTHDATLLNAASRASDLLDRDQVWVTEKSLDGSSALIAISEYRTPRKDEDLMRGYLAGRYGGIPMPSMFDAICSIQQASHE